MKHIYASSRHNTSKNQLQARSIYPLFLLAYSFPDFTETGKPLELLQRLYQNNMYIFFFVNTCFSLQSK